MARGYTPEELGLIPSAPKESRGYTPEELGLAPAKEAKAPEKERGYTPQELGILQPDSMGRFVAGKEQEKPALAPEEEQQIKEEYGISSEMGYPEYAGRLLKRAGKQAVTGFKQGVGGITTFAHDMLGINDTENKTNLDKLAAVTEAMGSPESHTARILEGAVSSIAQQLPLLGVGVVTGTEIPVLAGMFMQSFGQTYDESKREGLSVGDATGRAAAFGAFEVIGEKFGLGAELKALKKSAEGIPTAELVGYFAKALAREVPGEQLTYAGQFAVDKGYGMNPEAGFKDFLNGAVDTFYGTVAQSGLMMGAGASANKVIRSLSKKGEENGESRPGIEPGTDQLSLSLSGEPAGAPGGTGTVNQAGLDLLGKGPAELNGRERAINDQLIELQNQQAQIANFDPNDPRINDIEETVKELKTELKDLETAPAQTVKAMNAPEQLGLGLDEAGEGTQRTLETTPSEFGLTAPEGQVGVTTKAEPIQTSEYPTSKMMLVNTGVSPVKNLVSFFKTLKSAATSENEVKAHDAEVNKVIEEIDEFQKEAKGLDRTKRLTFLRDFIDKFSTAPEDKQSEMSRLPSALAGMNAEEQQTLLSDISQFPALNTVRGMKEFRGQLQEAMLDYTEAKLGRSRESAILPWEGNEDVNTQKDASELQRLGNISEKYMSPEEKAAKTYLTAHAPAGEPFGSALRAAAFDLGAEQGPVFPGQNKESAQLFRNWAAKNLHPTTLARFDATVEEYRQLGEKINKRTAEEEASKGKGVIGGRATGKAKGAGFGRLMHPSVETRIANNDLTGALRALSKVGNTWQKELSKKLLSLNLTTVIGYDKQENFAHRLVNQNVDAVRNQLLFKLEEEFPSVFKKHFANLSDIRAVYKALTELKDGKLGIPKETIQASIGQIEIVEEAYKAAVAVLDSSGTYFPHADALTLNRNRGGNNPNTFLHEILHAATHYALDPMNFNNLSAEQKQAVQELERTYKIAKELWGTGNEISSIDEFIVEAFTNPDFQRFLKDIPMPNQQKTIWNKFTDFIKEMFGLNNVLGYTLANANAILQAAPSLSTEAKALNQQGKLGGYILDDTFKAGPTARSFIRDVFSGKTSWSEVKEHMPSFLENAKDSTRKHLLGALTLRQLEDVVGPRVPAFKDFINNMEGMLDERNAMLNKTRDIVKPWMAWQNKNKEKSKILNALMLDATRLGIDPETNKSDTRLNKAWNDIGTDGQEFYIKVRDFYKNQLDAHIKTLLDRKSAALEAKGLSKAQAEASQEYKDLEAHFREHTIEPYFPIRRFGQYWLQVGSGKSKEFYMFESAGERNKFQKQREKQLEARKETKEISTGNSIRKLINENIQDFEFLSKLKDLIQTETGSTRQELKNNIIDSVEQIYLQTLPDQNIRKMFMNREGIQGMNQDMLRAFTASAFRIAYQQSRLAHSDKLYKAIDGAEARVEGMPANEKKVYGDYIGELEKRLQYMMNPPDTGKIPSFLSNVSFVWYMTSPASALVNMLGVPAVGIPVVGAKFGNFKTGAMMTNYARKFATTGFKKDGKLAFPSFANKSDMFNERQQKAFDKFIADGLIDITLTHDIVGLAETPSNLYTGRIQKVMQVLSGLFHGAEKFNREVVAMSAFDLSYEKNIKDGLGEDAAVKKAIEEAKDLTYKSMFDYSALNKPRFFQPAYAKVFLQFKQFSQQMTYMLARSAYEGFSKKFDANDRKDIGGQINNTRLEDGQETLDGKDLDAAIDKYIKEFKTEGKKRLMGTLGTTFIFAGATGLPGWAAFSSLMEILHYVFADEDEEDVPFDFDNWFKNWSAETFGGFVGDSISRGVASQASGVDLADRMSLNDMWFRDQRKQPDMQSAAQAYLVSLMGPAVGLGVNAFNAYDQYSQGHIDRAIETASPAIIKNSLKAARLGREGALTLSGDELIPDFSNAEIAAQAVGFQPERLAQKQKANIEMKNAEQEIVKKHQHLLDAAFLAIDTGDDDLFNRVMDKISRFNSGNPTMAITGENIANSVQRRYLQRAISVGGAKINKNLIGQLGAMGEYGNLEE
jgi:hypothetical protein